MYKTKQDYNINKAKSFFLGILITVGTGVAMIFGTGCHHEDPVTPPDPKPDPTDTIIIPTKEKTFDCDWRVDTTFTPPFDSLKRYVDDPTYK
ncbi:MAG: hypothetical protein K5912_02520 [Alphaproteobacteria bacterium]|nr:hypothetical protein [Alphaproteobacteria bacterium]